MKKITRTISIIVVAMLILMVFSGCKTENDTSSDSVQATEKKTEAAEAKQEETTPEMGDGETELLNPVGMLPIAKETTKLSILMAQDVLVEDYATNSFTKWVEENCNVQLEFELLPAGDEGSDKLSIMLASGQKLPDVVNFTMSIEDDYIYGSNGLFMDLTELYETDAFNIKQRLADYPQIEVLKYATAPDGKIYNVPSYGHESIGDCPRRCYANMDFLDALGMSIPTTTDEFYDVLVAIRDKDPNGNGLSDEIPLSAQDQYYLIGYLMNAFLYASPGYSAWSSVSDNYLNVDNGEISVAYSKDAFREGLRYMAKLCDEELLSPLAFTQNSDQFKQMTDNDGESPVVGFAITFATSTMLNNYKENPFTAMYEAIPPLEGPEGVRYADYLASYPANKWHITSYCENVNLAFRVADFMWSEEAYLRTRFGVQGEQWDYADAGQPSYFPNKDAKFTYVSVWNESQNVHWRADTPNFSYDDNDLRVWNGDPFNATYTCAIAYDDYIVCIPEADEFAGKLVFTGEENDEISEIKSTLSTYVSESIARFITGDLSIENDWEAYLNELDAIGLERFLEVCQAAYDRMN